MISTKKPSYEGFWISLGKNRDIASPQTIAPGTTISIIALFIFKSPSISFMTLL